MPLYQCIFLKKLLFCPAANSTISQVIPAKSEQGAANRTVDVFGGVMLIPISKQNSPDGEKFKFHLVSTKILVAFPNDAQFSFISQHIK